MPPTWQATPPAHLTQPLSVSLQLHPAIDTDAGSIAAAASVEDSLADARVQRQVPAAEAAQSTDQACCSLYEVSMHRDMSCSLDQLQHGEDSGQMGQPERHSRSSNGQSCRQHGGSSRSETGSLSRHDGNKVPDRQQHSGFRGVDASDQCSAHDSARLNNDSDRLGHSTHGSVSARLGGKSPFARMQQTGYGQAYSLLLPLKVCFASRNCP